MSVCILHSIYLEKQAKSENQLNLFVPNSIAHLSISLLVGQVVPFALLPLSSVAEMIVNVAIPPENRASRGAKERSQLPAPNAPSSPYCGSASFQGAVSLCVPRRTSTYIMTSKFMVKIP